MILIGQKIYFDKEFGEVLVRTVEKKGDSARQSTFEEDVNSYTALSERNRDTFDVFELEYGEFAQDFLESHGNYHVNVETKELEFSYPDPNAPQETPVFQKPLTEQILQLKENQAVMNRVVDESGTAQQELLELLIDMGVI